MRRPSHNGKSGDVMADNDKAKLRYDDFVGNVQPDPANPASTIMLSGFVGHGPEGHARIYPDPTLGTWYDIPEADIVHSMPIADSKLGGSYVWARASAQIKPGRAAAAATEAPQQAPPAAVAAPAHPNTAATLCTMPPACGATAVHTLCCLLTQPPVCPPAGGLTLNATQCICLTPVNTMACFTLGGCLTLGICPTAVVCPTVATCTPNGLFTPFGR
jgi:hypothetical protein